MKEKFNTLVSLLLTLSLAASLARAQEHTVLPDTIYSRILNEKRTIRVFLPENFDLKTARNYDILYVLDGEDFGLYAHQITTMEQEFEYIPPLIVVSIENRFLDSLQMNSRNRDLLPVNIEGYIGSGGADKFMDFIAHEVMPLIKKRYPRAGKSILFGHSYGGLFALYTLFTQPGLFQYYIASDPSIWWNRGYMNKIAGQKLAKHENIHGVLYLAGRSGELFRAIGVSGMDSILKAKSPPGLKWKTGVYTNELHGSVKFKSLYDGLKFIYFGYSTTVNSNYIANGIDFFPNGGLIVKNKPIRIMTGTTFLNYEPGIRYTTDGTEPTLLSPKYEFGMSLKAPAELTLKLFSTQQPSLVSRGSFRAGNFLEPVAKPGFISRGGMQYAYYKGNWDALPNLDNLTPSAVGLAASNFSGFIFNDTTRLACRLEGFMESEKQGYYTFYLRAGGQARLYINNQLFITIDGKAGKTDNQSVILPLKTGLYHLRIEYLNRAGTRSALQLSYVPPNNDELFTASVPIPLRLLYHKSK